MSRPIQILVAVVFVGLVIGIGEGIGKHGINPFTIAVVAIVLGTLNSVVKTLSKAGTSNVDTSATDKRLSDLESRMTDLQDIVISIDDRLLRADETTKQRTVSSD